MSKLPIGGPLDECALRSGLSYNEIATEAGLEVSHVHGMCKSNNKGSREAVLRTCFAMRLAVDDVNRILESRHLPILGGNRKARPAPSVTP